MGTVSSVARPGHLAAKTESSVGGPSHSVNKTVSGYNFKFTSRPSVGAVKSPTVGRKYDCSASRYDAVIDVGCVGETEKADGAIWKVIDTGEDRGPVTPGILRRKLFTQCAGPQVLQ